MGQETVQTPEVTISQGAGDCDDMAVLTAALATAMGYKFRFKTIGKDGPSHVYTEILDPKKGWTVVDPASPPGLVTPPPGYKLYNVVGLGDLNMAKKSHHLIHHARQRFSSPVAFNLATVQVPLGASRVAVTDVIPVPGMSWGQVGNYRAVRTDQGAALVPVGLGDLGQDDSGDDSGDNSSGSWFDTAMSYVQQAAPVVQMATHEYAQLAPPPAAQVQAISTPMIPKPQGATVQQTGIGAAPGTKKPLYKNPLVIGGAVLGVGLLVLALR